MREMLSYMLFVFTHLPFFLPDEVSATNLADLKEDEKGASPLYKILAYSGAGVLY